MRNIHHRDKLFFDLCCRAWGAENARPIFTVAAFMGIPWPKVVKVLWRNK